MMQDCPKCGFSQPKDRYCANCGTDIETFKPKSAPVFVRLFKNTGVQISIVIALILTMGILIYISQQNNLAELTAKIGRESSDPAQNGAAAIEVSDEAQPTTAAVTPPTTTNGAASAVPSATASAIPSKIEVYFVEITKPYALKISTENQVLSQSAQTRVLLSKNKEPQNIYTEAGFAEKLPGQKNATLKVASAITFDFNYPSTDGNDEIGFTLNLLPNQVSAETVEIEMTSIIILKNSQGSAFTTTESNSTFSFSPTNGIIILGVVPEEKSFEPDLELFAGSPLSILSSPQFKEQMSEFGIYLSVK